MIDTGRAFGLVAALSAGVASAVRVSAPPVFVPRRARSEVGARGLLTVREKLSGDNGLEEPRARAAADAKGGGGADGIGKTVAGLCTARRVGQNATSSRRSGVNLDMKVSRERASGPLTTPASTFARSFGRAIGNAAQPRDADAAIRKTVLRHARQDLASRRSSRGER